MWRQCEVSSALANMTASNSGSVLGKAATEGRA